MTTRRGTILAVEDEPRNQALLEAMLARTGCDFHTTATLGEARAWLETQRPALVLLDRHLPDGDGLDLAREIKARDDGGPPVPIVLVSASVLPVDRVAAAAAGCDGFIDKPIRIDVLLAEVDRHLGD